MEVSKGNLKDEGRQSRTVTEDQFIRNFIDGTWHNKQATDIVIKRRHNMIAIFMYILAPRDLQPVYFLTGYTEELLSCLLKCPVKLELQSLNKASDLTFKMI
ncbi:RT24-like protein [Mya arenaria]|uniref:RT24-like protein n=1 Tax=Mya arenaria TaxID=6604 RepID=A0ABY7DJI4_MYAAR|nr:RT24-like protein [Mya arenaria]